MASYIQGKTTPNLLAFGSLPTQKRIYSTGPLTIDIFIINSTKTAIDEVPKGDRLGLVYMRVQES